MANWKLHKYYRGFCLPTIRSRLIQLQACSPILSDDDVHEILKSITDTPSNAELTNKQFLEFLEQIWCIGAHLDIYLPYPEEIHKMEQLKRIVDKMEKDIFPYRDILARGFYPLEKDTKLSINKSGIGIMSYMFSAEHLNIDTVISGSLVQKKMFFEGKHLDNIEKGLDHFIASVVEPVKSPEYRKKVLSERIKKLQEEYESCE